MATDMDAWVRGTRAAVAAPIKASLTKRSATARRDIDSIAAAPTVAQRVVAMQQAAAQQQAAALPPLPLTRTGVFQAQQQADAALRAKRDADFLRFQREAAAKASAYANGDEVRLGVNNQIIAKRTADIDAKRAAQDLANAQRVRAEQQAYFDARGKRVVYGPGGSMVIGKGVSVPQGYSTVGPAIKPQGMYGPMPARKPTQVAADSGFDQSQLAGQAAIGNYYQQGMNAVVNGVRSLYGRPSVPLPAAPPAQGPADPNAGVRQVAGAVQAAAGVLGRMPTSYAEAMDVLGFRPAEARMQAPAGQAFYRDQNGRIYMVRTGSKPEIAGVGPIRALYSAVTGDRGAPGEVETPAYSYTIGPDGKARRSGVRMSEASARKQGLLPYRPTVAEYRAMDAIPPERW